MLERDAGVPLDVLVEQFAALRAANLVALATFVPMRTSIAAACTPRSVR